MPRRLLVHLSRAGLLVGAAVACGRDNLVLSAPQDAGSLAEPSGNASNGGAPSDGAAGPSLGGTPSDEDVRLPDAAVGSGPDAGLSNGTTYTRPAPDVIEPEWSDELRVCPPPSDYPALGYALTRQNHIDEWAGCERIDADFMIMPFEGADLRPLRSLREVRGRLTIGDGYTAYPHGFPSLEGLEGLRRVRGLTLAGIQASDLSVLRDLERVDDSERDPFFNGHSLEILAADNLVDLSGLENARGIYSLKVERSPALRSLRGVRLALHPNDWGGATISDSPVEDFADIALQSHLGFLSLSEVPLQSLDVFGSLRGVGRLIIDRNPELVNIDAIGQLEWLQNLQLTGNPLLATAPDIPLVSDPLVVSVRSNAVLKHAPGFPRVTSLTVLEVDYNPLLERLDSFPALAQLGDGSIRSNDLLHGFDFGALVQVTGTLDVRDNPRLDASSLAAVRGSIKRSGNLDPVPTLLSPCPWTDDDECDEPPRSDLCAPGTDPICALE